jgi:hypothetical protein
MLHVGRGCKGEEDGVGVTVAAAVAILERQKEEQRRTAPSLIRHRKRDDLNSTAEPGVSRDSSDSSVNSIGETIARLRSRFGVGGVGKGVSSRSAVDRELVQDAGQKSMKHVNNSRRNELTSVRRKEPDNFEVKTNRVVTGDEGGVNGIRKSPSTKNISSLVRNNSVVPTRNTATLPSSDSKTQDLQKSLVDNTPDGTSKLETSSRSSPIQCDKTSSVKQKFQSEFSNQDPGEVKRSSSAEEIPDQHDDYDDDGLGAASVRNEDLHIDPELQISVKGSTSDSKIPRKRPRVIHLRDSVTKNDRSKSSPEVASEPARELTEGVALSTSPQSRDATVRIVLEYPPPPPSPPPECEDRSGSPLTGGSSPSSSGRIVASGESLGSYSMTRTVKALLNKKCHVSDLEYCVMKRKSGFFKGFEVWRLLDQWYLTWGTRTPGGTRRHLRGYVKLKKYIYFHDKHIN